MYFIFVLYFFDLYLVPQFILCLHYFHHLVQYRDWVYLIFFLKKFIISLLVPLNFSLAFVAGNDITNLLTHQIMLKY